jgi:ferredoxin
MIVAERKPFEEIKALLGDSARVLLAGCGTCVKVCFTGGDKEVAVLASQLRLAAGKARRKLHIDEMTVERQCEPEFVDEVAKRFAGHDVVMSLACGAGVQLLASRFPTVPVLPAVNTTFLGALERQGLFVENCQGCGACVLGTFGGICPVSRCAKSLFNGPCGGSQGGMCEVGGEVPCAWHQIIERLKKLGRLDNLKAPVAAKDWRSARHGGPRKLVREENMP